MAINVNTVYQTVLLILNKEQRGYMTPQEFNSVATQVQLEVFENYFEDLNQQIRVPQADVDYSDRIENLDEKITIFKTFGPAVYDNSSYSGLSYFKLPTTTAYNSNADVYRLGTVTYTDPYGKVIEVERLTKSDFYEIQRSPLTKSNDSFPTYLYEGLPNQNTPGQTLDLTPTMVLYINPTNITSGINVDYIRKPQNVIWGFSIGSRGNYIFDNTYYDGSSGSINFDLHESEQINVILRILAYAGVIVQDPAVVQLASQTVQGKEMNKKS